MNTRTMINLCAITDHGQPCSTQIWLDANECAETVILKNLKDWTESNSFGGVTNYLTAIAYINVTDYGPERDNRGEIERTITLAPARHPGGSWRIVTKTDWEVVPPRVGIAS